MNGFLLEEEEEGGGKGHYLFCKWNNGGIKIQNKMIAIMK